MSHQQEPKNPSTDIYNLSLKDRDLLLAKANLHIDRDFKEKNGCWYWSGEVTPKYSRGFIQLNEVKVTPRVALLICHGFKINEKDLIFNCRRNLYCVNPNHLRVVERNERAWLKNRKPDRSR